MGGKLATNEKLSNEFSEMLEKSLVVFWRAGHSGNAVLERWSPGIEKDYETEPQRIWLVDKAKRVSLLQDALKFHDDIHDLQLYPELRKKAALQLAMDNNKVARHVFVFDSLGKHHMRAITDARERTKVQRIGYDECVDSQVGFIVSAGLLDEASAGKVSEIAKAAIESYREKIKPSPAGSALTLSAAAVYYASYKIDKRLSPGCLEKIFDVTDQTMYSKSEELVQTVFPKNAAWWKNREKPEILK
jgi:hypothetical protein